MPKLRFAGHDPVKFFARTEKDAATGCWNWTGSISPNGYAQISEGIGKREYVHRVAWKLTHGAIPDGLFVLHKCDNRRCVNPEHLFVGTHRDNMRDMWNKGRQGGQFTPSDICVNGHPLVGDNIVRMPAGKTCRTCQQQRSRASYERNREKVLLSSKLRYAARKAKKHGQPPHSRERQCDPNQARSA